MANQITDPPLNHDFGEDFNYFQWTANTDITLTNVPWNNDYRDVVWFDSTADLNSYIDDQSTDNTTISNASYAPVDRPITLDIPYNSASRFNYVRVYNKAQTFAGADVPRYFYYFITSTTYISTHNTQLTVQLDVFQTFIRQVEFGRCYIERGHIGRANNQSRRNHGRDFLTVPEGIDLGSEYVNVANRTKQVMNVGSTGYDILVISTTQLEADAGDRNNPRLVSAQGSRFMGIASGASFYVFPGADSLMAFMRTMLQKPWVTQGIISITAIPKLSRYYPTLSRATNAIGALSFTPSGGPQFPVHQMWTNWRDSATLKNFIPPRYRILNKFYTYPYMVIEATTFSGTPIILKPEMWNSSHATMVEFASLIPPETRIAFSPAGYNSRIPAGASLQPTSVGPYYVDGGEHLDLVTQITNLPRLAMVNNGALAALAGNAHSIAYGASSADWSQQRALRGNETSYGQASAGMNAASDSAYNAQRQDWANTRISQQASIDSNAISAMGGMVSGGAGGLVGGPAGAAIGASLGGIGATFGKMQNNVAISTGTAQLANRLASSQAEVGIQQGLSGYMRDTNKSLADWAAKGDYENAIAGINAKTQDMALTQPSISGQIGGEFLNLLTNNMGLTLRWKMIDQSAIAVIGEYWLRYGYAVRRSSMLPTNLQAMSKFTYWKLTETYIKRAAIPEAFKQAIRGIFEKGVTVWSHPDFIGVTDWADNVARTDINLESYDPPEAEVEEPTIPPVVTKRKNKKMLVFSSSDGEGSIYALAGTSPGTTANWIETRDAVRAQAFVAACGVDNAVAVTATDFDLYRSQYIAPLVTMTVGEEPEVA